MGMWREPSTVKKNGALPIDVPEKLSDRRLTKSSPRLWGGAFEALFLNLSPASAGL